LKQVRVTEQ